MAGALIGIAASALPELLGAGAAGAVEAGGAAVAEEAGGSVLAEGAGSLAANETIGGELSQIVGGANQAQAQLAQQINSQGQQQRQAAQQLEATATKTGDKDHMKTMNSFFDGMADDGTGGGDEAAA